MYLCYDKLLFPERYYYKVQYELILKKKNLEERNNKLYIHIYQKIRVIIFIIINLNDLRNVRNDESSDVRSVIK